MRKYILIIVCLLCVFVGVAQQIVGLDRFYYKSTDTCNIASDNMIGTSNTIWSVKLKKMKSFSTCQDSVFYLVRYSVLLGDEEKLFVIDYFVVDEDFCIISSLSPIIKRGKFELNVCMKKNQQLIFCLDGGEIFSIR